MPSEARRLSMRLVRISSILVGVVGLVSVGVADDEPKPPRIPEQDFFDEIPLLERLPLLKVEAGRLQQVTFSPDGRFIAAVRPPWFVGVWDAATGEHRHWFAYPAGNLLNQDVRYTFSADGQNIFIWGDYGVIHIYDLNSGRLTRDIREPRLNCLYRKLLVEDPNDVTNFGGLRLLPIRDVTLSRDGNLLIAAYAEGTICKWNARTGELLGELTRGNAERHKFAIADLDSSEFLLEWLSKANPAGDARQVPSEFEICYWKDTPDAAVDISVALSADARMLYAQEWVRRPFERRLVARNVEDGKTVFKIPGCRDFALGETANRLYVYSGEFAGEPKRISVYDARTGVLLHKSFVPDDHAKSPIALSPDGKQLLTRGFGCTIAVWNAETGAKLRNLRSPPEDEPHVWLSLAVSPGSKRAIATWRRADTRQLEFWNLTTGKRFDSVFDE